MRPTSQPFRIAQLLVFLIACGGGTSTPPDQEKPVSQPTLTTVSLDRAQLTFANVGLTDTLRATARDQFGAVMSGVTFTWTSSDATIATVNSGIVTTVGLGSAHVTATAAGQSATALVSVPVAVTTIALDKTALSFAHIGLRDTVRATVKDQLGRPIAGTSVTWTSQNPTIATVDADGAVTSLALGQATLSASVGAMSAALTVNVQAASLEWTRCTGGAPAVLLLIDAVYRFPTADAIARYASDLCAEGYTVWEAESVPLTPPAIRGYLTDLWNRSNRAPTHSFAYDVHDGDMNWELWIGVLPVYKGSVSSTTSALNRYFDKNHTYRIGGAKPPRVFLNVSEFLSATNNGEYTSTLSSMQTGQYAWTPFSTSAGAQFFFASTTPAVTLQQGYAALQANTADFFVAESHGFAGAAGLLTIATVESTPVQTTFFWSSGCSIGDLDKPDNFLTSVVYSPTSQVLVGKGTTNSSGGMGNNANGYYGRNIATAMAGGSSFGAAILAHVNVPLIAPYSLSREFQLGTAVVVGDPTLKLRP